MSKKRLGIGFIGGGFITRFHIQSLISVRNVDVIGVMSLTKASAVESAALARSIGVGDNAKAYDTITDMIADSTIDALWVCSPNFARIETFEEIANAISSGKGELIGVACEKPLGRNVAEAKKVLELTKSVGLYGYLENQVFSPSIVRGKEIIWARGASTTGRPYLARAAEEHSGPHMPWFWEGSLQGGGVLNDMMCHSVEEARFMLTEPGKPRESIKPISISAHTDCLKWQRPEYAKILSDNSNGETDYSKKPSEDFARSLIEYLDEDGNKLIVETTTSWCFVGEGLRLSMELFGPEYSMFVNTLDPDLKVFFSRKVAGAEGEDLVEKQNAESGSMPIVSNEAEVYGYTAENRHMVECFLAGKRPEENFDDGLDVTRLLMAAYMSAEQGKTIQLPNTEIETFIPAVARGEWNPKGE